MKRPVLLVALLPVVLLLAACGDGDDAGTSSSPTSKPSAEVSDTPTPQESDSPVVQTKVNAEDYLLEGGLNDDSDGDGFWSAHYGFYFEPTKSARCDIYIFSGDDPVVSCEILPGNESKVTYELPADAQCDYSTANPHDGYTMALGSKGLYPQVAGFSGCQDMGSVEPAIAAATKMLGEGQQLTTPPFECVVNGAAVGCDYVNGTDGSFIFGLFTAVHAG